jgi:Flp pilus assembly protein TadG
MLLTPYRSSSAPPGAGVETVTLQGAFQSDSYGVRADRSYAGSEKTMVRRRSRCRRASRRGTAAVELAVCLPFLIYIFLGCLDYGRIFYGALTTSNCSLNAAYMAADANSGNLYPYADVNAAASADATNLTNTTPSFTNGTDSKGNTTETCTMNYQFKTISQFPGLPTTTSLNRYTTVRQAPATP